MAPPPQPHHIWALWSGEDGAPKGRCEAKGRKLLPIRLPKSKRARWAPGGPCEGGMSCLRGGALAGLSLPPSLSPEANPALLLFSCSVVSNSLGPHGLQHARPSCPSPSPGICSNSCPLSQWYHTSILSSVVPFFSFCFHSFPASGFFPVSQIFTSGGQITGASASASILSMNIQDWFPLGLTNLISLLSKGLSRVFSNTTVQKHQFFGAQTDPGWQCDVFAF